MGKPGRPRGAIRSLAKHSSIDTVELSEATRIKIGSRRNSPLPVMSWMMGSVILIS